MRNLLYVITVFAVVCLCTVGCSNNDTKTNSIAGVNNGLSSEAQKMHLIELGLDEKKLVERENDFIYENDIVIRKTDIAAMGSGANAGLSKTTQRRFYFVLTNARVNNIRVLIDPSLSGWTASITEAVNAWNNSGSNVHFNIVTTAPDLTIYSDMAANCPADFRNLQENSSGVVLGLTYMCHNTTTPGSVMSLNYDYSYMANLNNRRGVIIHELAHAFGLMHTDNAADPNSVFITGTPATDGASIMNSEANPSYTVLGTWDYAAVEILFPPNFNNVVLAVGAQDYALWTRATANSPWAPIPNSGSIQDVSIMPNGTLLGVGTADNGLWTRATLNSTWIRVPNSGSVTRTAIMPNGTIVGIGKNDQGLWTRSTLTSTWVSVPNSGSIIDITVMPNGTLLAVGVDKFLWTRATLTSSWVRVANSGEVVSVTIMPDGSLMGVGTDGYLWTRATLTSAWIRVANSGSVMNVTRGIGR